MKILAKTLLICALLCANSLAISVDAGSPVIIEKTLATPTISGSIQLDAASDKALADKEKAAADKKKADKAAEKAAEKAAHKKRHDFVVPADTTPVNGVCTNGWHLADNMCISNKSYCHNYDAETFNCAVCQWYTFQTQNDAAYKKGTKTGNYCGTNWWMFVLWGFIWLVLLGLLIGLICYFCCNKKKASSERKPLRTNPRKEEPRVQAKAPVHRTEDRLERGPVKEWRDEPRITEHVEHIGHGERVHVSTRHYSPGGEPKVELHRQEDWGKWSQAHWDQH